MSDNRFNLKMESQHGRRWVVYDMFCGMVALSIGLIFTPYTDIYDFSDQLYASFFYGFLLAGCLRLSGLHTHKMESVFSIYEIISSTIIGTFFAYVLLAITVNFTHYHVFGRYVTTVTLLVTFILIFTQRYVAKRYIQNTPVRIYLLGGSPDACKLSGDALCQSSTCLLMRRIAMHSHLDLLGVACEKVNNHCQCSKSPGNFEIDDPKEFCQFLKEQGIDLLISCHRGHIPQNVGKAIEMMPFYGVDVINKGNFIEQYFKEISVEFQNYHWLTSLSFMPSPRAFLFLKRGFDLFFASVLILLLFPVFPLVALFIKLDSKGPVFYTQTRVGYLGKPFRIIKFRSMRTDAEKDGAQWATKNDSRVTKLGNLLRVTRLDEIPQLINIFRGEMSLIGPRPERPEFVDEFKKKIPLYEWRHLVPPGLTGWAQIRYKYGASEEDAKRKLQYDLYYVKKASLSLEIQILLQTLPLIMKGSR